MGSIRGGGDPGGDQSVKSALEDALELLEDARGQEQVEFSLPRPPEQRAAQTFGGEGGNEDVRIKDGPHETARKTSSSVTIPARFARRLNCRRTPRNLASQRYWLTDSFTMSLLDRPVCVARRLSSVARGSGRLTDKTVRMDSLRSDVPLHYNTLHA